MRRVYFLAPNKAISKTIVDELLLARIEARHPDAEFGSTEPEIPAFPVMLPRRRVRCGMPTGHPSHR